MWIWLDEIMDINVTNVLRLVHGWQNDGQQKYLFYESNEDNMCLADCGEMESKFHCI